MIKIYISTFTIFLITFCFSAFSKNKDNFINLKQSDPITIEEIEYVFWGNKKKYPEINEKHIFPKRSTAENEIRKKKKETYEKRREFRGIAKCHNVGSDDDFKKCQARVVRVVMSYSEKSKKRRPGDIFYALSSIGYLIKYTGNHKNYVKYVKGDKILPGMVCTYYGDNNYKKHCSAFKRSTYKKIEKLRNDPSNEKVLGWKLIKYVKNLRTIRNIDENLGTRNYGLIADFLNTTVSEVKKNNLSPAVTKLKLLLQKYNLLLNKINSKLDDKKYKFLDKDLLNLSKSYEELNSLNINYGNVDEAVNELYNLNLYTLDSIKNASKNENNKIIAQSSITFMQIFIQSILSELPQKYYTETKDIDVNLFNEYDLIDLEKAINDMVLKNYENKKNKLERTKKVLDDYFNTDEILQKMNSLGIKYIDDKMDITQSLATKIVDDQIRENLDSDILKSARKIFQEMDKNQLADITKEASSIASEVASSSSVKEATSNRAVDREYGGQNLKKLIGAARNR